MNHTGVLRCHFEKPNSESGESKFEILNCVVKEAIHIDIRNINYGYYLYNLLRQMVCGWDKYEARCSNNRDSREADYIVYRQCIAAWFMLPFSRQYTILFYYNNIA